MKHLVGYNYTLKYLKFVSRCMFKVSKLGVYLTLEMMARMTLFVEEGSCSFELVTQAIPSHLGFCFFTMNHERKAHS
jgi:hypothetical protein